MGKGGETVVPSLLDRLSDEDPQVPHDREKGHAQLLRELRASVLRDVGHLVNTRRRVGPLPPGLTELVPSLVDYGLADFLGRDLAGDTGREDLRRALEETLRRYEPRFRSLRVELLDNADSQDRTLRFRVDALLHAEPAPEPVVFDSVLDPVRGGLDVEGRDADGRGAGAGSGGEGAEGGDGGSSAEGGARG
jgi:type VI secretion system protein ImpF